MEKESSQEDFWLDQNNAQRVLGEMNRLREAISEWHALGGESVEITELIDLVAELGEPEALAGLPERLSTLERELEQLELRLLLSGPYDHNNAILEIHPGAGGVDSQDWAAMLMRMYTRWAERGGYKVEVLDYLAGDEAGLKSVSILITGALAYGYLQAEKGVHRLVRISPFDSSGRRHTSFASVTVVPEITEDSEVEIDTTDLRIDTFRASGAGGQNVNKVDSAVRITHLPSGIVVQCQNERSQLSNKNTAMRMLRSKLVELRLEEQQRALDEIRGDVGENAWGNQIRSYVIHPYSMVKDHRTLVETGNVQAVMDGDIDRFIDAMLRQQATKRGS